MSQDSFVVRPLTAADIQNVRDLHCKLLPIQYPFSFFLQLLILPNRMCFVAYSPKEINTPIGFISAVACGPSPRPRLSYGSGATPSSHLEILTLGVLPAFQNCGIATLLMNHVIHNFRQSTNMIGETLIHANVSTSNSSAIKFYERMGMTINNPPIKNFYRTLNPESRDAYVVVGLL